MYFFFSQCSVSVLWATSMCSISSDRFVAQMCWCTKGPKKEHVDSFSLSLNEPQTSLFIHHVNIRFTYISQRYLDWIYFSFLCFSPSLSFYSVMVCVCGRVCFFFPHYFCYLLCFTSYLFFYCVTHSLFSTIIPYFASFKWNKCARACCDVCEIKCVKCILNERKSENDAWN